MIAQGGWTPPANTGVSFGLEAVRISPIRDLMPAFMAPGEWEVRYFGDPAARWAFYRERELHDERRVREHERQLAAEEWPFEYPTHRRGEW